jgi:hypothetical protein
MFLMARPEMADISGEILSRVENLLIPAPYYRLL